MSQFVEVKTAELVGPALDWAVAIATGAINVEVKRNASGKTYIWLGNPVFDSCQPSIDWAQGGLLLDSNKVWLSDGEGEAVASCHPHRNEHIHTGPTRLIAACRAIVQAKLGDVVQVPAELAGMGA